MNLLIPYVHLYDHPDLFLKNLPMVIVEQEQEN